MLVQIIEGALHGLPNALSNMAAVFVAALVSVLAVSFFRGETTVFKTPYLLIIFLAGTFSPILGLIGGTSSVLMAQRKREEDQRELCLLFTLLLFALAYYFEQTSLNFLL